ncbi:hypothetical protein ABB37_01256 [Leptomonas pyrrhocoris]|uniref:Uncharacterized protein n=1 Tax=Leptomonas pyrrhocoris TaxID=157538 RepID=A0A0M9G886_LEPPY|nr:hypothetical protein ABB37_01256 [Leptomonas pyrrhocoris]XP_015663209.1 hypothetical protein ABB37_01256 [Leptomonas pyrrhocoris]KPA84769.1 hypothetical protein ABB37_01256 [Leptomonas pyrrhocoris]KPA84770.1 hypothetical protein ABB37_01256 [Leptomonas pyrrhocoris]|eukprot:XP_015663208.1 hypothetical protein ABB37_01256 [Leptomonas pyrrhocoris]
MADQPPPGVNMPKKRDPRLRQMQAPQQQQFFDSADYEVRKQQQQQQQQQQYPTHGQMAPNGGQRHPGMEGNARPGYGGIPPAPQQYQQRQFHVQQAPPSAQQNPAMAPPNRRPPAF